MIRHEGLQDATHGTSATSSELDIIFLLGFLYAVALREQMGPSASPD